MKKFLLLACVLGCCWVGFQLALSHLNDGFTLSKIKNRQANHNNWDVYPKNISTDHIKPLLNQNFYYLGKGSQCFVFESEDHSYVLKLFKFHRYRPPALTHWITQPKFLADILAKKKEAKQRKLDALFNSCTIAFEELQEETQLVYLHLNTTEELHQTMTIYDRLRRPYILSCDEFTFILQRKGEQSLPYLHSLIAQEKKEEAKKALLQLALLIDKRLKKGISDEDSVIEKNTGFIGGKAFFLDIGNFSKKRCSDKQEEINKVITHLHLWLQDHDPELAHYFKAASNDLI